MAKVDKLTKQIGERVKLCRENRNMMKQAELHYKLGIAQNHISNIENGKRRPSYELLLDICNEFGVTPNFFLLENVQSVNKERLDTFYSWAATLEEDDLDELPIFCDSIKTIITRRIRRED